MYTRTGDDIIIRIIIIYLEVYVREVFECFIQLVPLNRWCLHRHSVYTYILYSCIIEIELSIGLKKKNVGKGHWLIVFQYWYAKGYWFTRLTRTRFFFFRTWYNVENSVLNVQSLNTVGMYWRNGELNVRSILYDFDTKRIEKSIMYFGSLLRKKKKLKTIKLITR